MFAVEHAPVADGLHLAYVREGEGGYPLLLVHGYPETKRIWWRNIAPLADAGFEVIVPDLRGYGDSGLAPDAIPTEGDAGLAEAVHAGGVGDYGAKVPLGLGHVDDAAAAAVFLAGDLSRFVTGTTIHLDGGTFAASGWHKGPSGNYEP